jgi:hypothetical protein
MSTHTEKAIQLTAKFLDARDTMKRLNTPEEYKEKIAKFKTYITQGMEKWKCTRMQSALRLMKMASDSPFTILGLMAALVEEE